MSFSNEGNGTHSTTWGDGTVTNIAGDIPYSRVSNLVTLSLPEINTTALGGSVVAQTALPARLRPATNTNLSVLVEDSGVVQPGLCVIGSDGSVEIFADLASGTFGAAADGPLAQSVSYRAAPVSGQDYTV